jgi:predicted Rossmann fold flavoprotein
VDHFNTIVIGAGPAGLFCAANAVSSSGSVLLLEKNASCGKKLLITGSGMCNITHAGSISEFFTRYGDHGSFVRPALRSFTNDDLTTFFSSRGQPLVTAEGEKVFPESYRSADILSILLNECTKNNVDIHYNEPVLHARQDDGSFVVTTGERSYRASHLVIATGGASYPSTGSTGDGYRLAAELGHTVTCIAPALTGLIPVRYPFADLAGISFEESRVSVHRSGKKIKEQSGDLLFTHKGLSGPVILDVSRYIEPGDELKISFLAGFNDDSINKDLIEKIAANGSRKVRTVLHEYALPARFLRRIIEMLEIPADLTCAHLSKKDRAALMTLMTAFPVTVRSLCGFEEAMVTRGGVSLDEIDNKTMESRIVPRLFCIGEVLDIDGDTGGYNLQFAFSSAFLAAMTINPHTP